METAFPVRVRVGSLWKLQRGAPPRARRPSRTFLNATMRLPAQIVRQGHKTIYRLLGWNRWLPVFFRGWERIRMPLRC